MSTLINQIWYGQDAWQPLNPGNLSQPTWGILDANYGTSTDVVNLMRNQIYLAGYPDPGPFTPPPYPF